MTATTTTPPEARPGPGAGPRRSRQSFAGVLRGESIKFAGMRATWLLLGASVLLTVGVGVAAAFALVAQARQGVPVSTDTFREIPAMGLNFAHLFVASLAVLFVTVEWSSGSIRTTVGALDRRGSLLAAKALVVMAGAALTSLLSAVLVHALSQPIVGPVDDAFGFADSASLYHLGSTAVDTALVALMALGIGTLLRSTAGGIVTVVALLIVLPIVLAIIPWEPLAELREFLPLNAGNALIALAPPPGTLSHLAALLTLLGWTSAAVILGGFRLTRTDV